MTHPLRNSVFCLFVVFITFCQGLQFFMEPVPNGSKCGHMQCWADKLFTDPTVFSLINLSVYDVTQPHVRIQLASLSVFNQALSLDETKVDIVHTTGNISDYHAELTLALKDLTSCLNRSYMCELDFVNVHGHHESIQETVSSRDKEKCISPAAVFNEYAKVAFKIKTQSDVLETEAAQLKHRNQVLQTELSKLQGLLNSSHTTPVVTQVKCMRGGHHNSTREKFLLWDKVPALCDTETDGGGWVIIQRRTTGDVDFYKGWEDYKKGFGNPNTDFWLGLDNIHNLTNQGYTELRFDIKHQGKQYFAHYDNFSVANEAMNYRLSVSGYNGTAGDSFSHYHNDKEFSTFDREHPTFDMMCAEKYHGAWWYYICYQSNLNGLWGANTLNGVIWISLSHTVSASFTEMKIRHV